MAVRRAAWGLLPLSILFGSPGTVTSQQDPSADTLRRGPMEMHDRTRERRRYPELGARAAAGARMTGDFGQLDVNGDAMLSRQELAGGKPLSGRAAQAFAEADAGGDGRLNRSEFAVFQERLESSAGGERRQ